MYSYVYIYIHIFILCLEFMLSGEWLRSLAFSNVSSKLLRVPDATRCSYWWTCHTMADVCGFVDGAFSALVATLTLACRASWGPLWIWWRFPSHLRRHGAWAWTAWDSKFVPFGDLMCILEDTQDTWSIDIDELCFDSGFGHGRALGCGEDDGRVGSLHFVTLLPCANYLEIQMIASATWGTFSENSMWWNVCQRIPYRGGWMREEVTFKGYAMAVTNFCQDVLRFEMYSIPLPSNS